MSRLSRLFTLLALALPLPALADGSMRIEVEVYNGPLSKELEVQKAELLGTMNVTDEVLSLLIREFHLSECRLGCFGDKASPPGKAYRYCVKPLQPSSSKQVTVTIPGDKTMVGIVGPSSPKLEWERADLSWVGSFEYKANVPASSSRALKGALTSNENGVLEVKDIFSDHALQLYEQMFKVKKKKKEDVMLTKVEDSLLQVCPVLADVKLNMSSTLAAVHGNELVYGDPQRTTPLTAADIMNKEPPELEEYLLNAAHIGKILREGAEHWSTTQTSILLESKRARIVVARAIIAAAELGNEIAARADAIIKQTDGTGRTALLRQEIATSAYLRDAGGTDYLNIVDWLDGYPRKEKKWRAIDRTRMVERLITDANWSKVNTVFAQGKGKVGMVFVKDDIGNWNLKSYDNDPTELLQSYVDFGTTVIGEAAKLATGAKVGELATGLADAKQASQTVNEITFGAAGGRTIEMVGFLEDRVVQRLNAVAADFESTQTSLKKAKVEATTAGSGAKTKHDEAQSNLKSANLAYDEKQEIYVLKKAEFEAAKSRCEPEQEGSEALCARALGLAEGVNEAKGNLEAESKNREEARGEATKAERAYQDAEKELAGIEKKLADLPKATLRRIRDVLEGHADTLESLQKAALPPSKAKKKLPELEGES